MNELATNRILQLGLYWNAVFSNVFVMDFFLLQLYGLLRALGAARS